jgi:Do/DeqQ family serine protease
MQLKLTVKSNIHLATALTVGIMTAAGFVGWCQLNGATTGAASAADQCAVAYTKPAVLASQGSPTGIIAIAAEGQQLAENSSASSGSRAAALIAAPVAINSETIADIAQQAAPSVVNIEVRRKDETSGLQAFDFDMPNFGGSTFKFFYNGRQVTPGTPIPIPKISPKARKASATGSGFVIREDGYILTNAHLVKGASDIRVSLNDKRSFDASIVGTDSFSDLAVLKIDAGNLPALKLGSSEKLRAGEFAIAIGSPLGFDHTVTLGIISAIGRTITDINGNINFIQTDAAINPGNSGGPLLNFKGEAVGVNTAIQANAQNIGFSIPIDVAKNVAEELIHHRSISRPWLGISMSELNEAHAKTLGLTTTTRGVFVRQIFEGSPAQEAGLESGDVIQKIDDKVIASPKEVQEVVKSHKVNEKVSFLVLRGATPKTLEVTIGQYPDLAPSSGPGSETKPDSGAQPKVQPE